MEKISQFLTQHRLLALLIILVVTTVAYSNIISNEFLWDDPDFYQNWTLLYNFDHVSELISGSVPVQHEGVYRPVRSIMQLLLFQGFGPDNVASYHLVSLLIHLAAVVAVYFIIESLSDNRLLAWLTSLIFGLHPIHTESISYLTTSIDVLGAVLVLWSVYFYLRWRVALEKRILLATSIVLGWLAFFTYELALILPVLLLLIEWYKAQFNYQAALHKIKLHWAYWLGALIFVVVRVSVGVGQRALTPDPSQSGLPVRLLTMGKAFVKYIYLLFFPLELNVFHKIDLSTSLTDTAAILAWLVVIALVALALTQAKRLKLISFGILWFFISLAPFSNIFPTGIIMAEKYTYVASIGISLIIAYLIYQFLLINNNRTLQLTGIIIAVVIAGAYGMRTYARNFDWQSNETLWAATLKVRPDYGRVYSNLGFSIYKQGRYDQALDLFIEAEKLEPELPLVHHNLGNVYDELGKFDQSIASYQQALALRGGAEYYNYAETYNNLGTVYQKVGQRASAATSYQQAIEFDPNYFRAYSNLGFLRLTSQEYQEGQKLFEQALALNQNFAPAHHGLAVALINLDQPDQAIDHYQQSIRLEPLLIENYNHLASVYQQQDKTAQAIAVLEQGIQALPENAEMLTNLAIILANAGQFDQAFVYVQQALEADPNYQPAQQLRQQFKVE